MEKNLQATEAIEKLKELVEKIGTCMFITEQANGVHNSRPMAVIDVDHKGDLWFFTSLHSHKIKSVELNSNVELIFAQPSHDRYLHVKGRGQVVTDKKTIEEKWSPIVKAWFPKGTDDPSLCLLKIKSDEAHYWDSEHTKAGEMIRLGLSVITGKQLVDGVHGELHV